jgi:hypothetical protein
MPKFNATTKWCCPGCGLDVNNQCGYVNLKGKEGEKTTCHVCFDLFGRVVIRKNDPLYLSAKPKKTKSDKKKDDKAKIDGSPAENTRFQRPPGFVLPSRLTSFSTTKEITWKQLERRQLVDHEIDSNNPSNMYPESLLPIPTSGKGVAKWWLDSRGDKQTGITSDVNFLAEAPAKSHVYLRAEMVAHSTHSHDIEGDDIDIIICSAIALRGNLDRADKQVRKACIRRLYNIWMNLIPNKLWSTSAV